MLPTPIRFSGVVTDTQGKPLSDVRIDHIGIRVENVKTDAEGRFGIATSAPAVVFRKQGFQSKYWRVSGDDAQVVVLGSALHAKECTAFSRCASLESLNSAFCFPRVTGVNVSKQGHDVDYVQRVFWIKTLSGQPRILHGAGLMWGSGLPDDREVWYSTDYAEESYTNPEGFDIIDARGKSADGKRWRTLGHAFESASYRSVPEQYSAQIDRVLDGFCVAQRFKFPNQRR